MDNVQLLADPRMIKEMMYLLDQAKQGKIKNFMCIYQVNGENGDMKRRFVFEKAYKPYDIIGAFFEGMVMLTRRTLETQVSESKE